MVIRGIRRSLPWMLAVIVAVGIATLTAVPSAVAESPECPAGQTLACAAPQGDDFAAGLCVAIADPPEQTASEVSTADSDFTPAAATAEDIAFDAIPVADAEASNASEEIEEYDPWISFNEPMFNFNRQLDRFAIKPVAKVWDKIVPDFMKQSLSNALDNLGMPRRLVNKLVQRRWLTAAQEVSRFVLNTTVGFAGLWDIAKELGVEKVEADTGQTFGLYGAKPGPYLNLPLLPPLTVRDGIGYAIDGALDPISYFIPILATFGIKAGSTINDRAQNLELFENVEETVLDLYSAVRNGYLQRRQKLIEDARQD